MSAPFFEADQISVQFGGLKAVDGVSFTVDKGEVFTIIGPNGAGKTTVFNIVSRIYDPSAGRVLLEGEDITRVPPHRIAKLGIARTFQNIELFEHATVLQNLLIGAHVHRTTNPIAEALFLPSVKRAEVALREKVEEVIDLLDLAVHRDAMVAGLPYGARKVVELGRALCTRPKLLLLDEPSLGLAPLISKQIFEAIGRLNKTEGLSVFLVEQNAFAALRLAHRGYVMVNGLVTMKGTGQELLANPEVRAAYLEGGHH
jgi:branched-chain amino acid transport system ATP-binding protein